MIKTQRTQNKTDMSFTTNRELSWLKFNQRVLEEASDDAVPLFERLKFVAIFTSNLDEFYMIRVGSLCDLSLIEEAHVDNKSGMTAEEQRRAVLKAAEPLYRQRDKIFSDLEKRLRKSGISRLSFTELEGQEKKYIRNYFETYILPILSPQIVDVHHPFPHIENKSVNVALMLKGKSGLRFGIVPMPKSLSRLVFLPGGGIRYMLAEDIIAEYAETMFTTYTIAEKAIISVTRNADINPDDEALDFEEDFRLHMKKILKKRARMAAVRLEVQKEEAHLLIIYLCAKLLLDKNQVFSCNTPLDMSYVYTLEGKLLLQIKRAVVYPPFEPRHPSPVDLFESMIRQVVRKDILLCYPYESMEPFLRLIGEAAQDPAVISIKITLYRIDRTSKLTEQLIRAAERNKDVTVIMELRARFDEQNNIEWAERLEEAGCRVVYGFEGYKIHSKICLITRLEKNRIQYITQIGTGNYNEKTAKLYSDFSLMTADENIGNDAANFFKNMSVSNIDGHYGFLLVAPTGLKRPVEALIEGEMDKARAGVPSFILLKLNSLTDRDIIDKLSQASQAGVRIQLIVRGICCIVPGIPGKTENIAVTSIVGRFLEHARIYCFGEEEDAKVFISSADLMTRNTERRIEIACPVLDEDQKRRIIRFLKIQLADNMKARKQMPNGSYVPIPVREDFAQINSQEYLMEETMTSFAVRGPVPRGIFPKFRLVLNRLWPGVYQENKKF